MIRRWLSAFTFPMLSKELLEQAQQKRTYVFRFLYCAVLYFAVLINIVPQLAGAADPMEQLGRGRDILNWVNSIQLWMIFIFMPIVTSGTIADEKEKNTLQLLLLTRLSSWNIVFEKFLSRYLTMLGFLLMSLPLLGVAYALGGVANEAVWNAFQVQLTLAFFLGALSLGCSSYCGTSFSALLLTYFLSILFSLCGICFPVLAFFSRFPGIPFRGFTLSGMLLTTLLSIPGMIISFGLLLFARNVLFNRSTVQPTNVLLRIFRRLDSGFQRINRNRMTRGIQVLGSGETFPESDPVAWRERTHSLVGSPTHLMRLFSLMMIPLSVILFIAVTDHRSGSDGLGPIVTVLWFLSLFAVFISSTTLFLKEMNRQTLEVLLSVPLSTGELLEQKRGGASRLIELFQGVVWLVLISKVYLSYQSESWYLDLLILVVLGVCHRLQLLTVSWLGLLLGAWQKHLVRALACGILGVVLVWRQIPRYLISRFGFPIINLWYEVFLGDSAPREGLEWIGPGLEFCFTPLWIAELTWSSYGRVRESVEVFPWSLFLGLAYQWGTYRLVRRWAYRRSKRDLPRLTRDENYRETDEASTEAQTSPAMGSP